MRRSAAVATSVFWFVITGGLGAVLVPWLLTGFRVRHPFPYWAFAQVVGALLIAAGLVPPVRVFQQFVRAGGTPMPGAMTTRLVVDHKPKASQRLRRLDLIARDDHVSLLVHDYAEDWRRLWWVRCEGTAALVAADDDERRAALLDALAAKYPQYREVPPSGDVVLVAIERLTGWSGEDLVTGWLG